MPQHDGQRSNGEWQVEPHLRHNCSISSEPGRGRLSRDRQQGCSLRSQSHGEFKKLVVSVREHGGSLTTFSKKPGNEPIPPLLGTAVLRLGCSRVLRNASECSKVFAWKDQLRVLIVFTFCISTFTVIRNCRKRGEEPRNPRCRPEYELCQL